MSQYSGVLTYPFSTQSALDTSGGINECYRFAFCVSLLVSMFVLVVGFSPPDTSVYLNLTPSLFTFLLLSWLGAC